jgi:hypothetical protein
MPVLDLTVDELVVLDRLLGNQTGRDLEGYILHDVFGGAYLGVDPKVDSAQVVSLVQHFRAVFETIYDKVQAASK